MSLTDYFFSKVIQIFATIKGWCVKNNDSEAYENDEDVEVDFDCSEETCMKNPGHVNFIPITEVNTSHFPVKFQDQDLVETVKLLGDITVKISVLVSGRLKVGSGKIFDIRKNAKKCTCPCSDCKKSNKPKKNWWKIVVLTSAHVVNDDKEAKNSKCRLFYNNENSSMINIEGLVVLKLSKSAKNCRLVCVTCDEELSNRLTQLIGNFNKIYGRTFVKFYDLKRKENLITIVSHPHGAPKKVTIGKSCERKNDSAGHCILTYTADTCPGSTGAFVYIL